MTEREICRKGMKEGREDIRGEGKGKKVKKREGEEGRDGKEKKERN